jgi:hypothetical protein
MNTVSMSSMNWAADAGAEREAGLPSDAQTAQDAAEFKDLLQAQPAAVQDRATPAESAGKPLGEWLRDAGEGLRRREAAYFETVARAARTGDPVAGLAVQRQLSELYLDHGLAVKVISKTAQAADALTRLQ